MKRFTRKHQKMQEKYGSQSQPIGSLSLLLLDNATFKHSLPVEAQVTLVVVHDHVPLLATLAGAGGVAPVTRVKSLELLLLKLDGLFWKSPPHKIWCTTVILNLDHS